MNRAGHCCNAQLQRQESDQRHFAVTKQVSMMGHFVKMLGWKLNNALHNRTIRTISNPKKRRHCTQGHIALLIFSGTIGSNTTSGRSVAWSCGGLLLCRVDYLQKVYYNLISCSGLGTYISLYRTPSHRYQWNHCHSEPMLGANWLISFV